MHLPVSRSQVRHQRGDTLVEVLIAIAVISLVLGGAYVTANRSLQATRAAQERAIALKLAEAQIERIKGLAANDPAALFAAASPFCISSSTGLPIDASEDDCAVNESGIHTGVEPVFHLSITMSGNDFALTETWFNASGRTTDNLQLRYRVYE